MTAELPPFTPSLDWVRAKVGRTSADVYGAVLRYCQMGEGVCRAGLESIAQRAGVCRRTAITHLGRLVEFGLLVDETPNLRNHPHRYTVAECKPCTVQELHSAIPAPPQCNPCTPTVQELHYGSARIALEERDNPRDEEDTASPSPDLPDLSGMDSELDTLFGKKPGDTTAAVQEFKDAFPPGTVGDGQEMRPGATVPAHAPGSVDTLRDALLAVLLPAARMKGLPGGELGEAWQRAAAIVTGRVFLRLPGANGKRGKLTVAHVRQGAQLWVARNHWRSEFSPCNENVRNGLTEAIQAVIDAMLADVETLEENPGDSACDSGSDGAAEPMHTGRKTHARNGETHAHRPQNPGTGAGGIPVIQEEYQEHHTPLPPVSQSERDANAVKRFKSIFPLGTVGGGKGMRGGNKAPYQEELDNPLVAAVFDALDGLDNVPGGLITHTADERRVCSENIVRRFSEVTPEQITWGVRLWGVTDWREGATTLYSKGVPAEISKSIAVIVAAAGRGEDPAQVVQAAQSAKNGGKGGRKRQLAGGIGNLTVSDTATEQQRIERERSRRRGAGAAGGAG